jgi:hypothetical protein
MWWIGPAYSQIACYGRSDSIGQGDNLDMLDVRMSSTENVRHHWAAFDPVKSDGALNSALHTQSTCPAYLRWKITV